MCIILPLFVSIYNVDFLIIPGLLPLILTTDFKPKSGHIIFWNLNEKRVYMYKAFKFITNSHILNKPTKKNFIVMIIYFPKYFII